MKKVLIIIAVVIVLAASLMVGMGVGTCISGGGYKQYEDESSVFWNNSIDKKHTCQYPGCGNDSARYVDLTLVNEEITIPNEANFTVKTSSLRYGTDKERTVRDTGTYLVPQADGSYRVEERTYSFTYTEEGPKNKVAHFTDFSGYYCEDHAAPAKETLKKEVKYALTFQSPLYLIEFIISPAIIAVAVLVGVISSIVKKVKKNKAAKAEE